MTLFSPLGLDLSLEKSLALSFHSEASLQSSLMKWVTGDVKPGCGRGPPDQRRCPLCSSHLQHIPNSSTGPGLKDAGGQEENRRTTLSHLVVLSSFPLFWANTTQPQNEEVPVSIPPVSNICMASSGHFTHWVLPRSKVCYAHCTVKVQGQYVMYYVSSNH